MTLKELAQIYENQLLSKLYFIVCDNNVHIINSQKDNFMHLIGVQRADEFKNTKNLSAFFDECLIDDREVSQLTFSKNSDRNIVLLKTNAFHLIQEAINVSKSIYLNNQIITCAKFFNYKSTNKLFSISFCPGKQDLNYYFPYSLQVDGSIDKSTIVVPSNEIKCEKVLYAEKSDIFGIMNKYDKNINDVKLYVLNKHHPLAKKIIKNTSQVSLQEIIDVAETRNDCVNDIYYKAI